MTHPVVKLKTSFSLLFDYRKNFKVTKSKRTKAKNIFLLYTLGTADANNHEEITFKQIQF